MIVFSAPNKEKFLTDWIYIGLFSLTGCTVYTTLIFTEESKTKRGRVSLGDDD